MSEQGSVRCWFMSGQQTISMLRQVTITWLDEQSLPHPDESIWSDPAQIGNFLASLQRDDKLIFDISDPGFNRKLAEASKLFDLLPFAVRRYDPAVYGSLKEAVAFLPASMIPRGYAKIFSKKANEWSISAKVAQGITATLIRAGSLTGQELITQLEVDRANAYALRCVAIKELLEAHFKAKKPTDVIADSKDLVARIEATCLKINFPLADGWWQDTDRKAFALALGLPEKVYDLMDQAPTITGLETLDRSLDRFTRRSFEWMAKYMSIGVKVCSTDYVVACSAVCGLDPEEVATEKKEEQKAVFSRLQDAVNTVHTSNFERFASYEKLFMDGEGDDQAVAYCIVHARARTRNDPPQIVWQTTQKVMDAVREKYGELPSYVTFLVDQDCRNEEQQMDMVLHCNPKFFLAYSE